MRQLNPFCRYVYVDWRWLIELEWTNCLIQTWWISKGWSLSIAQELVERVIIRDQISYKDINVPHPLSTFTLHIRRVNNTFSRMCRLSKPCVHSEQPTFIRTKCLSLGHAVLREVSAKRYPLQREGEASISIGYNHRQSPMQYNHQTTNSYRHNRP